MYPDRLQLLKSIQPGMKPDRLFFLKVYGYEISFPGFADKAVKALEDSGYSKAREDYEKTVSEYQRRQDKELKAVAMKLRRQWEGEWWESVKNGNRRT